MTPQVTPQVAPAPAAAPSDLTKILTQPSKPKSSEPTLEPNKPKPVPPKPKAWHSVNRAGSDDSPTPALRGGSQRTPASPALTSATCSPKPLPLPPPPRTYTSPQSFSSVLKPSCKVNKSQAVTQSDDSRSVVSPKSAAVAPPVAPRPASASTTASGVSGRFPARPVAFPKPVPATASGMKHFVVPSSRASVDSTIQDRTKFHSTSSSNPSVTPSSASPIPKHINDSSSPASNALASVPAVVCGGGANGAFKTSHTSVSVRPNSVPAYLPASPSSPIPPPPRSIPSINTPPPVLPRKSWAKEQVQLKPGTPPLYVFPDETEASYLNENAVNHRTESCILEAPGEAFQPPAGGKNSSAVIEILTHDCAIASSHLEKNTEVGGASVLTPASPLPGPLPDLLSTPSQALVFTGPTSRSTGAPDPREDEHKLPPIEMNTQNVHQERFTKSQPEGQMLHSGPTPRSFCSGSFHVTQVKELELQVATAEESTSAADKDATNKTNYVSTQPHEKDYSRINAQPDLDNNLMEASLSSFSLGIPLIEISNEPRKPSLEEEELRKYMEEIKSTFQNAPTLIDTIDVQDLKPPEYYRSVSRDSMDQELMDAHTIAASDPVVETSRDTLVGGGDLSHADPQHEVIPVFDTSDGKAIQDHSCVGASDTADKDTGHPGKEEGPRDARVAQTEALTEDAGNGGDDVHSGMDERDGEGRGQADEESRPRYGFRNCMVFTRRCYSPTNESPSPPLSPPPTSTNPPTPSAGPAAIYSAEVKVVMRSSQPPTPAMDAPRPATCKSQLLVRISVSMRTVISNVNISPFWSERYLLVNGPRWYSGTMRALGSEGSPSARVRILSSVRM
ncbi:hypothetical protein E2C01_039240 [Portunus trituberculatus]|uniref:Uncharacterized protein n=2 Tax=Portunus trituberculatus TaxID=210409 RepID=A0A5B7FJ48_PORTR|nr:hypothetical protein [Portunus trituberculatus]